MKTRINPPEAYQRIPMPADIGDNLYLHRVGMDKNGNYCAWISEGCGRAKKIQTNGNAPAAHHKTVLEILADEKATEELKSFFLTYLTIFRNSSILLTRRRTNA